MDNQNNKIEITYGSNNLKEICERTEDVNAKIIIDECIKTLNLTYTDWQKIPKTISKVITKKNSRLQQADSEWANEFRKLIQPELERKEGCLATFNSNANKIPYKHEETVVKILKIIFFVIYLIIVFLYVYDKIPIKIAGEDGNKQVELIYKLIAIFTIILFTAVETIAHLIVRAIINYKCKNLYNYSFEELLACKYDQGDPYYKINPYYLVPIFYFVEMIRLICIQIYIQLKELNEKLSKKDEPKHSVHQSNDEVSKTIEKIANDNPDRKVNVKLACDYIYTCDCDNLETLRIPSCVHSIDLCYDSSYNNDSLKNYFKNLKTIEFTQTPSNRPEYHLGLNFLQNAEDGIEIIGGKYVKTIDINGNETEEYKKFLRDKFPKANLNTVEENIICEVIRNGTTN